jgi:hypothetical protein
MVPWLCAAAYAACDRWPYIWADMASGGQRLRTWVDEAGGWILAIVQRPRRWGWYPMEGEPPPVVSDDVKIPHCDD